jgi:hypothetical protein
MARKSIGVRSKGKNTITNVRVVDQYSGPDGARVDRMLTQMQNSHGQIRMLCSTTDSFAVNTTGPGSAYYSGAYIRNFDEFTSLAQQFQEYRVAAIRFDVYDIAPSVPAQVAFSTWHDVIPNTTTPISYTFAQVVDGPDAQLVAPGTGKVSFTWMAKGSNENEFQSTDTTGWNDFGGLRIYGNTATANATKFQIITKAIVDFRGRL